MNKFESMRLEQMIDDGLREPYYAPLQSNERAIESLRNYVCHGKCPGGWLTALLQNNLLLGVTLADKENFKYLTHWVKFIHWHVPTECHGSPGKLNRWMEREWTS